MNEIEQLRRNLRDALGDMPIVEQEGPATTMRLFRAVRELAETPTGGVVVVQQGRGWRVRSAERLQSDLRLHFARSLPGVIATVMDHDGEDGLITMVYVRSRHPAVVTQPRRRSSQGTKMAPRRRENTERPELAMIPSASFEDLDQDRVRGLLAVGVVPDAPRRPRNREDFEHAVAASGIAYVQRGLLVPTVAGLVALGLSPDLSLPGMAVRVVVEGKGEHVFGGCLFDLVERIPHLPVVNEGVGAFVVEELLLNAVAHRDWGVEARTQPLVLERTADRLELSHPGSIGKHSPRNPTLVRLLAGLCLADGRGEGLARARSSVAESGGAGPVLREQDGVVTASISLERDVPDWLMGEEAEPATIKDAAAPIDVATAPPPPPPAVVAPEEPEPAAAPTPPEPAWFPATPKQRQLLQALEAKGHATTRELSEALGWPRSSTRDVLASLVKAGHVQRLAPLPRSPVQVYELVRRSSKAAAALEQERAVGT